MKTVITPEFVKNFSCIADKCEDHCCHGWDILIDKPTYSFMTKKSDLKIKSQQVIVRTRSAASYAKIKLDENGVCPFREQAGLCEVHKAHGHSRLSHTCQSYPRLYNIRGEQLESSLTLSCPEAARQILLNPSAMNFHSEQLHDNAFNAVEYERPQWYDNVRQLFIDVLLLESLPLEERLFLLGMTLKYLDAHQSDIDDFNQTFTYCCEKITNGEFSALYERMNSALELHASQLIKVFNVQFAISVTENQSQVIKRMHLLHELLVDAFEPAGDDVNKQKEILLQGFNGNYQDYFNNNSHVWLNYFIYKMYQHDFPADNMYEVFTDIVTDFFILRGALAAIASQRPLQESDIILAMQSYHRSKDHRVILSKGIKNLQKQLEVDDKMLPLMLLKMS
ncbi:Flagellar biosynthetic protein fliU [Photobacterium marinum]|uniref:Flagellar biosynthetic protein fliU n=1 Tax=Photobacterium marinum TaxID=1056511 RepID=L8JI21_9GAMM|nr:flagellin lysine-N-methylase [Photobacterium marinum]ELR67092.1 Flagellar biosynthetic protein fliU [Photobacterium marinum]